MNRKTVLEYQHIASRLNLDIEHVWTFRRKAMTLHNWFEKECGDSNNFAIWAIERMGGDEKPFRVTHYHNRGKTTITPIPDREKGARKAIAKLCKELGLYFFVQTDCRGLALYLSREELTDTNYNLKGFGVGF